jgi:hypothetical protein
VEGLTRGEFDKDSAAPIDASQTVDSSTSETAVQDSAEDQESASDSSGTTTTAFTGAGAYATDQPTTTAVSEHMTNNVGVTPGLGVDCLTCHKMGGPGAVFLFGGTVFQDMAGTMPAVDQEVRVLDSNSVGYSAHSDADGNFWYKMVATSIAFPAMSGVRNATQTVLMTNTLTASNCNGCHDKNTTDPLHIP